MAAGLDVDGFSSIMAGLGPFEAEPLIAVGVSGGRDSMALALLAHQWAGDRGGRAVALTVDHGLRPEAAEEARQVGRWLSARGMDHQILTNQIPLTHSDIQAAARSVRYGLLEEWCARNGCLHLLIAHQQNDQAETLLLRLGRGSGLRGLTSMAPVSILRHVRLLRPLLGIPRTALGDFLAANDQPWIDDPSNDSDAYARVRVRKALPDLASYGLTASRLSLTVDRLASADAVVDRETVQLQTHSVWCHPWGWGWLAVDPFADGAHECQVRVLAGLMTAIGGQDHGPRSDRLLRLLADVLEDHPRVRAGVTFHGCRLKRTVAPEGEDAILVTRELRTAHLCRLPSDGSEILWDGRFRMAFDSENGLETRLPISVGPVGQPVPSLTTVIAEETGLAQKMTWNGVPGMARPSLPALYQGDKLVAIPHLGWTADENSPKNTHLRDLRFSPARAMGFVGFRLAAAGSRII